MSDSSAHMWALLGGAVLGIIGAATAFVIQYNKKEKTKQKLVQDIAYLHKELDEVKNEIRDILEKQKKQKGSKSSRNSARKTSSNVSTVSDDYMSASNFDSSDLEFYDVSDDEESSSDVEKILQSIDMRSETANMTELDKLLEELERLAIEYPRNADILYRIGRTFHKMNDFLDDKELMQNNIAKGVEACSQAVIIDKNNAEVHKWYAILIGSRGDFQSMSEKIADGHLFKKHVDKALEINPNDPLLHHLLGRFNFEVASLKWYERKVAAALFGEPPTSTFEEASENFMKAEKIAPWKENRLHLAKCRIAQGEYKQAMDWLSKAEECGQDGGMDPKVDSEVKELIEQYKGYR